jgi:hypothetical protein
MNDDSSTINLDFFILILIIIVVALFIGKYIMPNFSNDNNCQLKKRNRIQEQMNNQINNTHLGVNNNYDIEDYGNLPDGPINEISNSNYQLVSNNNATKIINKSDDLIRGLDTDTLTELSKNYNNMNNLPYLVDPKNTGKGFLNNKVKLIENPNSPLLKLDTKYKNKINQNINKCPSPPKQFFDGYNKYNDLRKVNYANVTAIGKNLIVPFTSFPIAS